jgi:Gluconate 2-dehydrogenase subunit 3
MRWSRRAVVQALTATLVVGGSAVAILRTRGYTVSKERKLVALAAWQYVVVEHAARRIVASDRPSDTTIPSADDVEVAGFVDRWVFRLSRPVQRDLGRFLAFVEHMAPLGIGLGSRFTRLTPLQQDGVLSSIEGSSSDLLRAGFEGLRSLVFMGYYRDARTWAIVSYDGPLVNRPAAGWR